MAEDSSANSLLLSRIRDLREVPLARVRTAYQDDVSAIVGRLVAIAPESSRPPVAAFSSAI